LNIRKRTILLYGRTRAGKSTQIGELAEFVYQTEKKKTRLYTADRGGVGPLEPFIKLGLIEVVAQENTEPFIFANKIAKGYIRDAGGKWVPGKNDEIGLYAYESMTALADAFMNALALKAGENINIGGGASTSFSVNGDGETLKISGNNMSHYNVVQQRITEEVWNSQKLNASYILWTASASKDEDSTSSGKVLGPAVCGKALTSEVPRWFDLTFRIDALAAKQGNGERHILYLGNNEDTGAGNAVGLGNTRVPKDAPELPTTIEPASIVQALKMIDGAEEAAFLTVKKRLAL